MTQSLYLISTTVIIYTYIGYPLILYLLSFVLKRPVKRGKFYPYVSIIMSVYNEERAIKDKIENLLDLNYPQEKLEILIGSDGSTDKTNRIASGYTNDRIKLYVSNQRQGKPSMLNLLTKQTRGEIIVFTDARQRIDKDAFKALISNFSDKNIGSVSAELFFEDEDRKKSNSIGIYWEYEKFLRVHESRIGSMLGATGAMYAIRKELFSELPKDIILDDVYTPLKIVENGYRAVFEPDAKIFDKISKNESEEFKRKTRTLCGNFQIFAQFRHLFNPFKSPVAWQLFSHKFLRLCIPFFLILLFISNAFMLDSYFYQTSFILQIAFYSLALLGLISKNINKICNIPYMFCVMNSAALVGLYRFLTKKQKVAWRKAGY